MGRKLSPEEVAQLGLDSGKPGGNGGEVTAEASASKTSHVPPKQESKGIFQQYLDALGRGGLGGKVGGAIGGIAGGALAGPLGVPVGAFVGNLAGQGDAEHQLPAEMQEYDIAKNGPAPMPSYDPGAAAADAGTQAAIGLGLRGVGSLAARAGFPRVAGVLGARTPAAAVKATVPEEVSNMSTQALKNVDAGSPLGSGAVQELAKAHRLMTPLNPAIAAESAGAQVQQIPGQMAQRTPGLAAKTKSFTDALQQNVPADKVDAAFRDALSVPEAASNPTVMAARSQMAQEALPQGTDAMALQQAQGRLASARSVGVGPGDAPQLAADRAGYTKFAGPYVNRSGSPISQTVPQRVSQMIAPEYLKGPRALQVLSSELQSRGVPSLYPKAPSTNPLYSASPSAQSAEEIMREFLESQKQP